MDRIAPGPVRNLRVRPASGSGFNKLSVTWTAPAQDASNPCTVDSYNVEYTFLRSGQCPGAANQQTKTLTTSRLRMPLSGLEPYSTYNVKVTPSNSPGNGTAVERNVTTRQTGAI